MRLVDRKTFLALPAGTIYAAGKPEYFEQLSVKGDTWENDWTYLGLVWVEGMGQYSDPGIWDQMLKAAASVPLQSDYGRDGGFDEDQVFLIYERADLEALRAIIETALVKTP